MSILGILGTIHNDDMREEFNFSLERLKEIILEFNPDIICGEIRPEDWAKYCDDKSYDGYLGPSEYRGAIIDLCRELDIEFIPIDWFEDDLIGMDYFKGKSEEEKKVLEKEFSLIIDKYLKEAKESKIPFNSEGFNRITQEKQKFQEGINPEVHNVYWTCRNQLMTYRIKAAMKENNGKKILCTVGAEHVYYYLNELNDQGWDIVFPLNDKN